MSKGSGRRPEARRGSYSEGHERTFGKKPEKPAETDHAPVKEERHKVRDRSGYYTRRQT